MSTDSKSSNLVTCFNVFVCFMGSGLLALSEGVKDAGILAGFLGIIFFWILNNYTCELVIKCKYLAIQQNQDEMAVIGGSTDTLLPFPIKINSFVDIAELALGAWGKRAMMFSIFGSQIGFCCTYLIYITHTVQEVMGDGVNPWLCVAAFIWVLVLLVWLPSLKFLAPTSLFASFAIVAVCGLVLYVGSTPTVQANIRAPWDMPLIKLETFSVFFGIACFAYTVQGVVLSFELQMAKPEDFPKVIRLAIFLVMVIYATIGCAGYIYFQEDTNAPITNNLDNIKEIPSWLSLAVKSSLSLALICCYPLQMLPVVIITEKALLNKYSPRILSYTIRTALVLGTAVVAEIIPFFGLFAGLVGGLTCASMTCVMPCLCYLKLNWNKVTRTEIAINATISTLGIIASASSTVITVVQLVSCFQNQSDPSCK